MDGNKTHKITQEDLRKAIERKVQIYLNKSRIIYRQLDHVARLSLKKSN